jgi:O-antigen/teichoic acid export membrane protein
MSVIRRQAILNTLVTYLGVGLGAFNTLYLYPRVLPTDQIGLVRLLISISLILVQFSTLGMLAAIPKFFPVWQTEDRWHGGMLVVVGLISALGTAITLGLLVAFQPQVVAHYAKSPLLREYYFWLLPLTVFQVITGLAENFTAMTYRTVFTAFVREVLLRMLTTVLLIGVGGGWVSFDAFVQGFMLAQGVVTVLNLWALWQTKQFRFTFTPSGIRSQGIRDIIGYGLFMFLSGATLIVAQTLDGLMLASYQGLSIVGVFTTFSFVGTFISIPARALKRIARPVMSHAFAAGDHAKVQELYAKTTLIQLLACGILYVGIVVNEPALYLILPAEGFAEYFGIFIFIGLGLLVDSACGLNTVLIAISDRFRFDMLFNILLIGVGAATNIWLIPLYGGWGAALATCITLVSLNMMKWAFVWYALKLQPFGWQHLGGALLLAACWTVGYLLPDLSNLWLHLFTHTAVCGGLFLLVIRFTPLAPELQERIQVYTRKALGILGK